MDSLFLGVRFTSNATFGVTRYFCKMTWGFSPEVICRKNGYSTVISYIVASQAMANRDLLFR